MGSPLRWGVDPSGISRWTFPLTASTNPLGIGRGIVYQGMPWEGFEGGTSRRINAAIRIRKIRLSRGIWTSEAWSTHLASRRVEAVICRQGGGDDVRERTAVACNASIRWTSEKGVR